MNELSFDSVLHGHEVIGHKTNILDAEIFFGNRFAHIENLPGNIRPHFLKQVHGTNVVENNGTELEADAHWTKKTNFALGVYTADCIPGFVYAPTIDLIAGFHAGWRGVQNQVAMRTLEAIVKAGALAEDLWVVIGPHIQRQSFEIEKSHAEALISADPTHSSKMLTHSDSNKSYVDLQTVVTGQVRSMGVKRSQIFSLQEDTLSNSDYYSYRRDGKTGRLISYIILR